MGCPPDDAQPADEEIDDEEQPQPGSQGAVASRDTCGRCNYPLRVCLCEHLPSVPFATETRLVVLIHPKETRRACGTLPLLRLCLRNLKVVCGASFGERPEEAPAELLQELCVPGTHPPQLRDDVFLVAPGPTAQVLGRRSSAEGEEVPSPGAGGAEGRTLVFVDATWRLAKQMVYRSPWLQDMPRVCLNPEEESHYGFRRQPKKECLSTLEAVAECLLALETDLAEAVAVHTSLFQLFDAMVASQMSFIPQTKEAQTAPSLRRRGREGPKPPSSYCLVRYERGVNGVPRRGCVEETLRSCGHEVALARAKELSEGRSPGDRLNVIPLEKVRRQRGAGDMEFVME